MSQVVDTETAREFMKEVLNKAGAAELEAICAEVEHKSKWFADRLSAGALPGLSEADYHSLLGRIFSARRNAKLFRESFDFEDMRSWIGELLWGDEELGDRFEGFVERLERLPEGVRSDFASELLHFSQPERCWLWTRWIWDPRARTGALPLVTSAFHDLSGKSPGEVYLKVGRAIAFVHEVGAAAGFQTISRSVFGTDVFLSAVYVVYAYTVLKMRMTREFNQVIPGLREFSRRLLGVHGAGTGAGAGTGRGGET